MKEGEGLYLMEEDMAKKKKVEKKETKKVKVPEKEVITNTSTERYGNKLKPKYTGGIDKGARIG